MPDESSPKTLAIGMTVTVSGLNGAYEISEGPDRKGQYLLIRGNLRLWAAAERLEPTKPVKKPKKNATPAPTSDAPPTEGARLKIDLHGLTVAEALERLNRLLDRAVLEDAGLIEVIHGIGTGAIKTAVLACLGSYPHVTSFTVDPKNAGTTCVYF